MNIADLKRQVSIEFELIEETLAELALLSRDVAGRPLSKREVAAAGLYLANFYNGIENILKRISIFHHVPLPSDDNWHITLLRSFCHPPRDGLPSLLDPCLWKELAPYRSFRHVVTHGYGLRLRWEDMSQGVEGARAVFERLKAAVLEHLRSIEAGDE